MNKSPDILTKEQFFSIMRMYGAECGFDYPLYGLKDMYQHYLGGLWPIAVTNALKMFPKLQEQYFIANKVACSRVQRSMVDWKRELFAAMKGKRLQILDILQELDCELETAYRILSSDQVKPFIAMTKKGSRCYYSLKNEVAA